MIELKITKEEWNTFPAEKKEAIRNMGIILPWEVVKSEKKPVKSSVSHAKDYYLGVYTRCISCGTVQYNCFLMSGTSNKEVPNLTALCPIPKEKCSQIEPDQTTNQVVKICKHCKEIFSSWEKERLVEYILNTKKLCFNCPKAKER